MIKLDGHFLNNMDAIDAINRLNKTQMPAETAYRVSKIVEVVMREMKKTADKAIAIHKKYCLLDPTGMPSGLSQGKLEFLEPKEENEKKHDAEFVELLNIPFEIKVNPIPLQHLGSSLSPKEISSLTSILALPEDHTTPS